MAALVIWCMSGTVQANDCFPPEVETGSVLEGRNTIFKVVDIHKCWIKVFICRKQDDCREDPYWVHATEIELFKVNA